MATNDYRLEQLSATDLSPGATVTVTLRPKRSVQSDAIDGEEARGQTVTIALTNPERQDLKAILDRAAARMDFRRAAKALDPLVNLGSPQVGEP